MSYDNVKLWFAKREDESITTIDEINEENKNNTYLCPMCGSILRPKAVKSKQVTSHFAHVDTSKCSSETAVHFWFKHSFIEKEDVFTIISDKERQYICKDVLVEQIYDAEGKTYKPDMTITTECGSTIYFEMAFSNKKKVQDYIDIWLELKNIVVEVDIKELMSKNTTPTFKALFYDGKCFNIKKNDTYYNTIGKYKVEKLKGEVDEQIKERIKKLDWFWDDISRYKNGEVNIEHMVTVIDSIDKDDKEIFDKIFNKNVCNKLRGDYDKYHKEEYIKGIKRFEKELNEKYNGLIEIKYDKNFIYHHITVISMLRNSERLEIGSTSGGWYFNKFTLESNIEYINKCIQWEVDDIKNINIQNKTIKNQFLLNSIDKINEKYRNIDKCYELVMSWNARHGCSINSIYHIYLHLKYNNYTVLNIDITNEDIVKTDYESHIFNFIDEKINDYRLTLTTFENKTNIVDCLNKIVNEFKEIKDMLPPSFYKERFISHDIVSFSDKNEEYINLAVWFPYNNSYNTYNTYGHFKWMGIHIGPKNISYYIRSNDKHLDIKKEYNDITEFENCLRYTISDQLKDCFKFSCIECQEDFYINLGEIIFFKRKGLTLPKRCKCCRNKRKINNN